MSTRLRIQYRYQKWIGQKERDILSQTFLDIPCGTKREEDLYSEIVKPYIQDETWLQLINFTHHKHTNRLMHCMHVSYLCFLYAYRHKWDYKSAAIGGLLHDFVLFSKKDSKINNSKGFWCFSHPKEALKMAESKYNLNKISRDIITKHMFPAVFAVPRYKETWAIVYWDKYCAIQELIHKKQGCPVL